MKSWSNFFSKKTSIKVSYLFESIADYGKLVYAFNPVNIDALNLGVCCNVFFK